MHQRRDGGSGPGEAGWLADELDLALRTAFLITGDQQAAEGAVAAAFRRAWRFRRSLEGPSRRTWLYRLVVSACVPAPRAGDGDVLAALPAPVRVAAALRWHAGLAERDVARATGQRAVVVRARLHEARRRLAPPPVRPGTAPGTGPGATTPRSAP